MDAQGPGIERGRTRDERRTLQVGIAAATLGLVAVVAAAGLLIDREAHFAEDPRVPLWARVSAARIVVAVRPFSREPEIRYTILRSRQLFAADKWDAALQLLRSAYRDNPGNESLRAELHRVSIAVKHRDAGQAPDLGR